MGVARLLRVTLSILLLMLSVFAYSVGEQRGAFLGDRPISNVAFDFLDSLTMKARISESSAASFSQIDDDAVSILARRAPLDPIPLEVKTSKALANADESSLQLYARLALQRQPRSLTARLANFSYAADRSDTGTVIAEYSKLNRLGTIDKADLADALIGYFRELGEWDPLLKLLTKKPSTGRLILIKLFREDVHPSNLNDIVQLYPDTQSSYLTSLLRDDEYFVAHAAWMELYEGAKSRVSELPFNPEFRKRDAPAPFNWSLSSDLVEYRDGGGLDIVYFGTGREHLVRQVMRAPAGRYSLIVSMSGQMHPGAGDFQWKVQCLPTEDVIAAMPMRLEQVDHETEFSTNFSIPREQCEFQSVSLYGESGKFPQRSRVYINSILLTPSDSETG